jgi:hypothetical protein
MKNAWPAKPRRRGRQDDQPFRNYPPRNWSSAFLTSARAVGYPPATPAGAGESQSNRESAHR